MTYQVLNLIWYLLHGGEGGGDRPREHCKFFLNFNQKWPDYIFKILHLNYLLILNWKWPDYIDLASTSNLLYNLWSFQKCYKYIKKHTHIHTHKYSIFYAKKNMLE
jgi:hypothetical protein